MQKHTWMMFLVIPVISPNYFMQKASYMQAKLIADTITNIVNSATRRHSGYGSVAWVDGHVVLWLPKQFESWHINGRGEYLCR